MATFFTSVGTRNKSIEPVRSIHDLLLHDNATYSGILVSVQDIDGFVQQSKKGKCPGHDGICAEHIIFGHPIILTIISILFSIFIKLSFVPGAFVQAW